VRPDQQFIAARKELDGLLEQKTDWEDRQVDLAAAILDNVAYWLLYLESNYQHLEFDDLELWRGRFFEDPDLLAALHCRLTSATVTAENALLRDRLLRRVELALSSEHVRLQAELGRVYEQLGALAAQSEQRQVALASKLGFDARGSRPLLVVYSGLRFVASAQRRARIHQAFVTTRDLTLSDACEVTGRIAGLQRALAEHKGFSTPLAASLEGSTVDQRTALAFLDDYLKIALDDTRDLTAEISDALGEVVTPPLAPHAGRYLAHLARGRSTPGLSLQGCLDLAFDVASRIFGVACAVTPAPHDSTVLVAVRQQGRLLGRIQINLQGGARSPSTPNLTVSARELPVDDAAAGIPVAMISCRFSTRGTTGLLNLQNAHSLLHEFGHAINHVQLSHRAGSSSGLDNLPVERLELMSMWFERWVFSEDIADRCALSEKERGDLAFAVQAKSVEYRLSHVERSLLAGVDLLMHGDAALDVHAAYVQLGERHQGLGEHVLLAIWSHTWGGRCFARSRALTFPTSGRPRRAPPCTCPSPRTPGARRTASRGSRPRCWPALNRRRRRRRFPRRQPFPTSGNRPSRRHSRHANTGGSHGHGSIQALSTRLLRPAGARPG
jgi:oligopeptidase A